MRRPSIRGAAALLLALASPACVTGSYGRVRLQEPVAEADLAGLAPGRSSLGECLQRLGAPRIGRPADAQCGRSARAFAGARNKAFANSGASPSR